MIENKKAGDSYFKCDREEMLPFIPESANTVLDIGCGQGNFGAALKARLGKEVWGVELTEEAAKEAGKVLDKVYKGEIERMVSFIPEAKFDCIVFNDVLEHLIEPKEILKLVKSKLSDSGVIVASIPNVRYAKNLFNLVIKKDWEYEDSGILDHTHLRFFTQKSIISMFDECGYKIVTIAGINPIKKTAFTILNFLTLGFFDDTKYLQFAVVAKKSV